MSSKGRAIEAMIERGRKRYLMIKNYKRYLPAIKRACEEVFGKCELYVFGSVLTGKFTAGSDVDLMIKVQKVPKASARGLNLRRGSKSSQACPIITPLNSTSLMKRDSSGT